MAIAIVGMGLPGAGKTTRLKPKAKEMGADYICADDIRADLYGDASEQHDPGFIWGVAHDRIRAAIAAGRDVVVDGTFAKRRDRMELFRVCKEAGAELIELIWYQASPQVCNARNMRRDRVVPPRVIQRMSRQIRAELPDPDLEGFNTLEIIVAAGSVS
jgi:predicted kinase